MDGRNPQKRGIYTWHTLVYYIYKASFSMPMLAFPTDDSPDRYRTSIVRPRPGHGLPRLGVPVLLPCWALGSNDDSLPSVWKTKFASARGDRSVSFGRS